MRTSNGFQMLGPCAILLPASCGTMFNTAMVIWYVDFCSSRLPCSTVVIYWQSELEDDLDDLVAVANGEKGSTSMRSTHTNTTRRGTGRPVTMLFDDDSSDNGDGVRDDLEKVLGPSKVNSSTTKAHAVHHASATSSSSKSHHSHSTSSTTSTSSRTSTIRQRLVELVRAKVGKEVRAYLFDIGSPLMTPDILYYETAI